MGDQKNNLSDNKNEILITAYKELISKFFAKNYPFVDPDQYWNWLLGELGQNDLDINNLTPTELQSILDQINLLGNQLFDSDSLKTLIKAPR